MKQLLKTKQFKTMLSYFLLAVAIICAYKLIVNIDAILGVIRGFWNIISPFVSGFLIAYVLSIPCGGLQKLLTKSQNRFVYKRRKILSILTTYVLLLLIVVLILYLVIPSIYNSIAYFIAHFQTYYNSAQEFVDKINDLDIVSVDISMSKIMSAIQDFSLQKISSSLNALFSVSSVIFSGFLAFISSIYILIEKESFKAYLCRLLHVISPNSVYEFILKFSRDLNMNFKQYIYTQTIDGCILGTLATIELWLIGSRYALVLGIMLGIVNYIPYFGAIFGSIAAVIVIAFTQGMPSAILTAVVLLITQQIDGNIIQPKLMGGSFAMSPLLIIISITIGGAFAGPLGMIAAIPIVAVLKNVLQDIMIYFEQKKIAKANEPQAAPENNQGIIDSEAE